MATTEFVWNVSDTPAGALLPRPVAYRPSGGDCPDLAKGVRLVAGGAKAKRAASFLKAGLSAAGVKVGAAGVPVTLDVGHEAPGDSDEGYWLSITPTSVTIRARGAAGLFYGAVTLLQLIPEGGPCRLVPAEVEDYPTLSLRGISVDFRYAWLTESQVRATIDKAAAVKANCIVWWLQDKFVWKSHPNLVHARALTPKQWKALVKYADDRFIQMVPYVDIYGHGENYLDRWGYFPMSNGEMGYWRHDDVQYCASDPRSMKLIRQLFTECLPVFNNTKFAHVGLDEVDTREKNLCVKCAKRVASIGKKLKEAAPFTNARNRLIAERFMEIHPWLAKRGRRAMFWDDSATSITCRMMGDGGWELVPEDVVPFVWFYDANTEPVRVVLSRPYAARHEVVVSPSCRNLDNIRGLVGLTADFKNVIGVIVTLWELDVFRIEERWEGFGMACALGWNRDAPAGELMAALKRRFRKVD